MEKSIYYLPDGRREYTGNPWKKRGDIHRDFKGGTRQAPTVLANVEGTGTCIVPWYGPKDRDAAIARGPQ